MVAIALFFFWPAVVGKWQQVSALRQTVAERQDLLQKRQAILANVSSAYKEYQSKLSQADGAKFAALVPLRKDQAELVSALQDIANTSGVTVNEVRVTEDVAAGTSSQFKTLTLNLDLGGSYQSLRTFLTNLESYVRLLNVDTISVSQDARSPGKLQFTIKAAAYFLK